VLLKSVNVGVLAALFNFGAAARPDSLGIQVHRGIVPTALCYRGPRAVQSRRTATDPLQFSGCAGLKGCRQLLAILSSLS
jgi:hypothetical protein